MTALCTESLNDIFPSERSKPENDAKGLGLKSMNDIAAGNIIRKLIFKGGIINFKCTPHNSLVKLICLLKIPIKLLKLGASSFETGTLSMDLCTYLWTLPSVVQWKIHDWIFSMNRNQKSRMRLKSTKMGILKKWWLHASHAKGWRK